MDRWRSWNAAKLPGRAVNRFVRGWVSSRLTVEVHRTACIVTHPPGGEHANDALCVPANERLAGTRFTPEECWTQLYGDPITGRWDKDYATYPFQSIDGLVTEFGGDGLRRALEAMEARAEGVRCPTGGAVVTRSHGELLELYSALVHAVPPFYRGPQEAEQWEAGLTAAYRSALDAAAQYKLGTLALPLLGAGARGAGAELPIADALRVAAGAVVGWPGDAANGADADADATVAGLHVTARFGVQDSSTAHALADAVEAAIARDGLRAHFAAASPPPKEKERWALEN